MKNILILTPDRVGSTLLQRLITIYAYYNNLSMPIPAINLHELTNGIHVNYSNLYHTNLTSKQNSNWSYYQSLQEITSILQDTKHPVIARIAKYHFDSRDDPKIEQMQFYQYLNENFFIISARRQNIFEQAISWTIVKESKKLNVYSVNEKLSTFGEIYAKGLHVDQGVLEHQFQIYREYEKWSNKHFMISSHFYYDKDFENIEDYIFNLAPFIGRKEKKSWKDFSGLSFNDWNRIHYLTSMRKSDIEVTSVYSSADIALYKDFIHQLSTLVSNNVLPSNVPYKLQTFKEKTKIINNFSECLDTYKKWALQNGAKVYSDFELLSSANAEENFYNNTNSIRPISIGHDAILDYLNKNNDKKI